MRRSTVALGTAALVVGLVLPAFAAASFNEDGRQADASAEGDHTVTLTVDEVPAENEAYGDTVRVRLVAPPGFTFTGCEEFEPVDWPCTRTEGVLTWERRVLTPRGVADVQFGFTTTVPGTNGSYAFTVTQSDEAVEGEDGEPQRDTVTAGRPTITVVGGQDPPPEPTEEPAPSPSPTASADDDAPTTPAPESEPEPEPSSEPDDEPDDADDADDEQDEDDEPAPRPTTQQRSTGTDLGVGAISPSASPRPQADEPAVADDPVLSAPDNDGETVAEDDGTVAATGSDPTQGSPGEGVPWQQWAGGALFLAGGLVLLWRRFGDQLPSLALPRLPWRG